jgi:hypothetical protein
MHKLLLIIIAALISTPAYAGTTIVAGGKGSREARCEAQKYHRWINRQCVRTSGKQYNAGPSVEDFDADLEKGESLDEMTYDQIVRRFDRSDRR